MNTERFLEETLLSLLKQKPVTRIFVSEILGEVGVCKATFYKHYCDKYDLLQKSFYHAYYEEILAHAESFEQFTQLSLAAFRRTPKVVLHAMAEEDPSSLFGYHCALLQRFLAKDRRAAGKETEGEPYASLSRFYARCVTQVTAEWLSAPRPAPADETLRLIKGLFPVALA